MAGVFRGKETKVPAAEDPSQIVSQVVRRALTTSKTAHIISPTQQFETCQWMAREHDVTRCDMKSSCDTIVPVEGRTRNVLALAQERQLPRRSCMLAPGRRNQTRFSELEFVWEPTSTSDTASALAFSTDRKSRNASSILGTGESTLWRTSQW